MRAATTSIRVNNRKVLDGVHGGHRASTATTKAGRAASCCAPSTSSTGSAPDGVRALLGAGRSDESGDFTKGAGLGEAQAAVDPRLSSRRAAPIGAATCASLRACRRLAIGLEGVQELEAIAELLAAPARTACVIDPSVVRGLDYYTGPVYEAELTFEVLGDDGQPRQFGSVAGGGRYDDLVARFTGEAVPATGFSIGVDRLLAALGEKGAR